MGYLNLAEKIRLARIRQGMSQADLARAVGITRGRVSQIELGISGNPSMDVMKAMCKTLGITEAFLLKEDVPEMESHLKLVVNMVSKLKKSDLKVIEALCRYFLKEELDESYHG